MAERLPGASRLRLRGTAEQGAGAGGWDCLHVLDGEKETENPSPGVGSIRDPKAQEARSMFKKSSEERHKALQQCSHCSSFCDQEVGLVPPLGVNRGPGATPAWQRPSVPRSDTAAGRRLLLLCLSPEPYGPRVALERNSVLQVMMVTHLVLSWLGHHQVQWPDPGNSSGQVAREHVWVLWERGQSRARREPQRWRRK